MEKGEIDKLAQEIYAQHRRAIDDIIARKKSLQELVYDEISSNLRQDIAFAEFGFEEARTANDTLWSFFTSAATEINEELISREENIHKAWTEAPIQIEIDWRRKKIWGAVRKGCARDKLQRIVEDVDSSNVGIRESSGYYIFGHQDLKSVLPSDVEASPQGVHDAFASVWKILRPQFLELNRVMQMVISRYKESSVK